MKKFSRKDVLQSVLLIAGMSAAFVVLRLLGGYPFNVFYFASGFLCAILSIAAGIIAAEIVISIVRKVGKKEPDESVHLASYCVAITALYLLFYFKTNWW